MPRSWGCAAYQRNQLRITAKQLQLRNVSQLAAVTHNEKTYMGRLDAVEFTNSFIHVTIGGTKLTLDHAHPLEIQRTSAAESLAISVDLQEDIADGLVA